MAIIAQKNKYLAGNPLHEEVLNHSRWLRFVGFVLLCLGLVTMTVPLMPMSALHSIAVLSGLLAVSGVLYLLHAAVFWQQKWLGFSLYILAGVVYATVGYLMFVYPLANLQWLAQVLIVSYVILGVFRITMAMAQGLAYLGWGWTFVGGVINLLLALFISTQLSIITTELLGLTISIEFLFTGWALFRLGVNARRERSA